MGHQKSFSNILNDQIQQKNKHHQDTKAKKEKINKLYS